jgi:uncharacterized glyoxalase superfamily protein PhnB
MPSEPRLVNVVPTLRYRDAPAMIAWLNRAFGFSERLVVPGEGDTIRHAQLEAGRGIVMVGTWRPDDMVVLPGAQGPVTQVVLVVVTELEAHLARALEAGADLVHPLTTQPHGSFCAVRDPEGHVWGFGDYDPWA